MIPAFSLSVAARGSLPSHGEAAWQGLAEQGACVQLPDIFQKNISFCGNHGLPASTLREEKGVRFPRQIAPEEIVFLLVVTAEQNSSVCYADRCLVAI